MTGFAFDAATRFARAPLAVLASIDRTGAPHVVPIVFAVHHNTVYTAVDAKPKTTKRLKRLANIEGNPQVSLLADHYADDWTQLWWVRADGIATVHHSGEQMATGYALLRRKYPQYQRLELDGPVVTVEVARWTGWEA